MSYDPSHRKPRHAGARSRAITPEEAWPALEDGYAHRDAADGYAGTAVGYAGAGNGWGQAGSGWGQGENDYHTRGYGTATRTADWDGWAPGGNGYGVAPDTGVHPDGWRAEQEARRAIGRRGPVVGAVTELLAAAVAIGVATLAAAFVGPQASPITAVGNVVIDRTPLALKNLAMHHFGGHGRTVLLLGMYVVLALVALEIGVLTRRAAALGVAGIAALSLLGAFIVITRPESRVSDVTPMVIGGLAGVAALLWLHRASAPVASFRSARGGRRRA